MFMANVDFIDSISIFRYLSIKLVQVPAPPASVVVVCGSNTFSIGGKWIRGGNFHVFS